MNEKEVTRILHSLPGMPALSYDLRELALILFENRNALTVERDWLFGDSARESYSVRLGEHNIGRYSINREPGLIARRFFCLVADDCPLRDFPFQYLTCNSEASPKSDAARIIFEWIASLVALIIDYFIDVLNPFLLPPRPVNILINERLSNGSMPEYGQRIVRRLLIPGLRPGVAFLADSYGDKFRRFGMSIMYFDRRGRLRINFAVTAYMRLECQAIQWGLEWTIWRLVHNVASMWVRRLIAAPLAIIANNVMWGTVYGPMLYAFSDVQKRGIWIPVVIVVLIYHFAWRFWVRRQLVELFEALGGNYKEEWVRYNLERAWGFRKPRHWGADKQRDE